MYSMLLDTLVIQFFERDFCLFICLNMSHDEPFALIDWATGPYLFLEGLT